MKFIIWTAFAWCSSNRILNDFIKCGRLGVVIHFRTLFSMAAPIAPRLGVQVLDEVILSGPVLWRLTVTIALNLKMLIYKHSNWINHRVPVAYYAAISIKLCFCLWLIGQHSETRLNGETIKLTKQSAFSPMENLHLGSATRTSKSKWFKSFHTFWSVQCVLPIIGKVLWC